MLLTPAPAQALSQSHILSSGCFLDDPGARPRARAVRWSHFESRMSRRETTAAQRSRVRRSPIGGPRDPRCPPAVPVAGGILDRDCHGLAMRHACLETRPLGAVREGLLSQSVLNLDSCGTCRTGAALAHGPVRATQTSQGGTLWARRERRRRRERKRRR